MPQMANITVKAADNTTDVTYTAVTPSAGDKSPAVWKNTAIGTVLAARPTFTFVGADNGTRKARRMRSTFMWPKVKTDSAGNVTVNGGASAESSHLIPQDMTHAEIAEFVSQYAGLLYSALIVESTKSGYAPG